MSSSDTWPTVLHRLVGNGKLSQVVSDHLWLYFSLVENLSVVDANDGTDHLGKDDHITQVCLHCGRLLQNVSGFLCLLKPRNQVEVLPLQSTSKAPSHAAWKHLCELITEMPQK